MKKFQYKMVTFPECETEEDLIAALSRLGNEGWELCIFDEKDGQAAFICKRELPED